MKFSRRQLLRWHVWLGWLIGVPLVLWTVTGLVMVARPIEVVRGTDLRIERPAQALPRAAPALPFLAAGTPPVTDYRVAIEDGRAIARVTYANGERAVFDASGARLTPIDEAEARRIVRNNIVGAREHRIVGAALFAREPPLDFRQPSPVWQVRLADGTHVYVGRDTAQIEAVRTRWWRVFDFMWGLHIMDLETREDTHHPILILFAVLGSIGTVLGCVLMIRRYGKRPSRA